MEDEHQIHSDPLENHFTLKKIVDDGLLQADKCSDLREAKGILIEVQSHFKGLKLLREHREELYNRLQQAFTAVNTRIDEEKRAFEETAWTNYTELRESVEEAASMAAASDDLRLAWDRLISVQDRMKQARLLREHRELLFNTIQQAFSALKEKRDAEKHAFEHEAAANYQRLKKLVDQGLQQAEETHEYKETREFLKKIQSEFKGIRLVHEQREELYSRLQTAFDILGRRLDDFFRNKKKNWQVKMEYTLSRFNADIFKLEESVKKDREFLSGLEDQLDIIESAGKDTATLLSLKARITSIQMAIDHKNMEIRQLQAQQEELQTRMNEPEPM
jgi:hypothetical protein